MLIVPYNDIIVSKSISCSELIFLYKDMYLCVFIIKIKNSTRNTWILVELLSFEYIWKYHCTGETG